MTVPINLHESVGVDDDRRIAPFIWLAVEGFTDAFVVNVGDRFNIFEAIYLKNGCTILDAVPWTTSDIVGDEGG